MKQMTSAPSISKFLIDSNTDVSHHRSFVSPASDHYCWLLHHCLRVSSAVERYHGHGNSYKENYLI